MERKRIYILTSVYALVLLAFFSVSAAILMNTLRETSQRGATGETEYVYIYVKDTEEDSSHNTQQKWIVKEHEGRIGIFSEDGELYDVIDTYIKTLPEADRRMLGEGIEISSRDELNSIIEDYSD